MSELIALNPMHPNPNLLDLIVRNLQNGAVIAYPSDSGYALGCALQQKQALERLRSIRQLNAQHNFTLICRDLSEISKFAEVSNAHFKLLKRLTPGGYTFILPGTRAVPDLILSKQETIGIRIPDHPIPLMIAEALQAPLLSTTLIMPEKTEPLIYAEDVIDEVGQQVELIIDAGFAGFEPTSVLDLTSNKPIIIRRGSGNVSEFE
jgi:tRNA threonylcarbamoyl adenosine modification protein (Sua5/YciO/YrdC/YwlC family)